MVPVLAAHHAHMEIITYGEDCIQNVLSDYIEIKFLMCPGYSQRKHWNDILNGTRA